MDKRAYRRRVLLNLLTRPLTLIPLVGGTSLLLAGWAAGQRAGVVLFAGVLGVLAGAGKFLSSVFLGGGKTADRVFDTMKAEAQQKREQALDDLVHRLQHDGDPRTERALSDLRTLVAMYGEDTDWTDHLNSRTGFDLLRGISSLFDTSVGYLEKSLTLKLAADRLQTEETRRSLAERREVLIEEVQKSIKHLGEVLGSVQHVGAHGDRGGRLGQLREELDANLEIARRVEERMAGWEADVPGLARREGA